MHNRILNFVSKVRRRLYTVDLAAETWFSSTTVVGLFDMTPDFINRMTDGKDLYFCEDDDKNTTGYTYDVHGRSGETGQYFTVVKGDGYPDTGTESTGLAFSPDNKWMYVAYYGVSAVYKIWRTDGLPFGGTVAYTNYHQN